MLRRIVFGTGLFLGAAVLGRIFAKRPRRLKDSSARAVLNRGTTSLISRRRFAVLASFLMLAAGLSILAYAVGGGGKPSRETLPQPESFVAPTAVAPTPVPEPTPNPSDAPIARLVISKIKVDAR